MKTMKRFAALLLVVVLMTAMLVVPANAAGTGSITIDAANNGAAYNIWKIFDYVYVAEGSAIKAQYYTISDSSAWYNFVTTGAGNAYVALAAVPGNPGTYYVTAKTDFTNTTAATFATLAIKYAKDNSITSTKVETASGTTVTFDGLDLGYYLVDSGAGAIGHLDTTTPSMTVTEKNKLPSIDKKVNGLSSDVVGMIEELNYSITVSAEAGAQNYVVTDTLPSALHVPTSVAVSFKDTTLTNGTDYVLTISGNVIKVDLTKYCEAHPTDIKAADKFVITYTTLLDADKASSATAITNTATLTYGSSAGLEKKESSATVYTYEAVLTKTDSSSNALQGAQFTFYYKEGGVNKYAVVDASNKITAWSDTPTTFTTGSDGKITIIGLGDGTYYFEETKAPEGYVLPSAEGDRIATIEINNKNASATMTNHTGSMFPTTGGIGTTIFYALGGIMVLAAVVFIITRRRMIEE